MLLLLLFAVVAGTGTAITPCVLPVLPALLSASALGGRRRPFGIILGLAGAFMVSIIALAQFARGVGLASGAARTLAVVVLITAGVLMVVPALGDRVQAPLSRLARFGPHTRGTGFWSGLAVGAALGLVCAPCAGPILAAVISVSASGGTSARVVAVALAYVLGLSAVLMVYGIGGRRVIDLIRRRLRGHNVERSLGAILVLTGVVMALQLDVRFEEALAGDSSLPAFLVDPTRGLETSHAVQKRLLLLRPASPFVARAGNVPLASVATSAAVAIRGVQTPPLPDLGSAPSFRDNQRWFNTPAGRPLTIAGLRGHVVLVDFWTYTCINCIRTLPFFKALYSKYHPYGLEVVGVETPEFTFEQEASNVEQAIHSDGIHYPVVQDNDYATWNAYHNQTWPGEYLIDADGRIRLIDEFQEGGYKQLEAAVRELLYEAGAKHLPSPVTGSPAPPSAGLETSETYLGWERAAWYVQTLQPGTHDYTYRDVSGLPVNVVALNGHWGYSAQSISTGPGGGSIDIAFDAEKVYLVLTSRHVPVSARVLLDGRPISVVDAGTDVHAGHLTVYRDRLYNLVALRSDQRHVLTVELPQGVTAYDFTFG